MAAGFRSPLPILGLGAEVTQAGVRSMLAPWLGGAGVAGVTPETSGGYRSLLAFWVGGAGAVRAPSIGGGGGGVGLGVLRRIPVPPQVVDDLRQQLIDEDELMLLMAAHIAGSGLLN
jgi:hypothetical protein